MAQTTPKRELKNVSYELFIMLLSLLSLVNLVLLLLPFVSPVVKGVVAIIDWFLTAIFLADFLYRLLTSPSKSEYFLRNWGWADLLASLPFQQLKIFRLFRVFRVFRLLRELGPATIVDEIRNNRAGNALYLTVFLVFMVLEFGGIAIVNAESSVPDANIQSASDAVWWAFVTITTVGYGDRFPVSANGRLIGMAVMLLGVGLFGVLTGFLANAFLTPQGEESAPTPEVGGAEGQIAEFRQLLDAQDRANAALRARLTEIEALLLVDQTGGQPP